MRSVFESSSRATTGIQESHGRSRWLWRSIHNHEPTIDMKRRQTNILFRNRRQAESGSVLVIVLLITIGLISMAIYFANSMSLELRAADNRASGLAAEQAIEGGARYIRSILSSFATNGAMPD